MLTLSIAGKILEGVFGVPWSFGPVGRVGGAAVILYRYNAIYSATICYKKDIHYYSGIYSGVGAGLLTIR